eukprot:scaffold804_cov165-Amphora_coffeaeformis.AAC.4
MDFPSFGQAGSLVGLQTMETKKDDYAGAAIPGPTVVRRGRSIRISMPSKKSGASKLVYLIKRARSSQHHQQRQQNEGHETHVELKPVSCEKLLNAKTTGRSDEQLDGETTTLQTPPVKKQRSFLRRILPSLHRSNGKKEDHCEPISPVLDFDTDGGVDFEHILRDLDGMDIDELKPGHQVPWTYDEPLQVDGKIPIVYHVDYGSDDSLLMDILTENSSLQTDDMVEGASTEPQPTDKVKVPFGALRRPKAVEISDASESSKTVSSSESSEGSSFYDYEDTSRNARQHRNHPTCSDGALESILWIFTGNVEEKKATSTKKSRHADDTTCWFGFYNCTGKEMDEPEAYSSKPQPGGARVSQGALKRMLSDAVVDGGTLVSEAIEKILQKAEVANEEDPIERKINRRKSKQEREEQAAWETFPENRQHRTESRNAKETKYWLSGFEVSSSEDNSDPRDSRVPTPDSDGSELSATTRKLKNKLSHTLLKQPSSDSEEEDLDVESSDIPGNNLSQQLGEFAQEVLNTIRSDLTGVVTETRSERELHEIRVNRISSELGLV